MTSERTDRYGAIVIGAGQAGLAVGYHLARQGRPFVILDELPRVGDVWRSRWDSLRLFTPGRYDGLPGMRFPAPPWSYPTRDQVADFLEAYADRFDLPVRGDTRVERVWHDGETFRVESGSHSWAADDVVVASGSYHTPRIPPFAADLDDSILQLHSSEYRRPDQIPPGPVLVVGAANSGAEIALEVARDHPTWLSGRHPGQEPVAGTGNLRDRLITRLLWFAASRVIAVTNPLGRKVRDRFLDPPRGVPLGRVRLKQLLEVGAERVPRTVGVEDGAPVVEDGRALDVRTVIWCTGFEPDFGWVDLPVFGPGGWPVHERGVVAERPGLYFMGLLFQHTLSSALLGGVGRDAAYVAEHIRARRAGAPSVRRPTRPQGSPARPLS